MLRLGRLTLVWVLAGLGSVQLLAAQTPKPAVAEGHWSGWMMVRPGSSEIDMAVSLERSEDGVWGGTLSLPIFGVLGVPLGKIETDGADVLFQYTYSVGTATFEGKVSEDGDRLEGGLTERGRTVPVVFERQEAALAGYPWPEEAEVTELDGVAALQAAFNEDQGKTRVVILLSPTCNSCKTKTRLVHKHVTQKIASRELRIYVVWEPILDNDSFEASRSAGVYLQDPRVRHFWIGNGSVGEAFSEIAGLDSAVAWNVFFAYGPDARWGEAPPSPAAYLHDLGDEVTAGQPFDARELADSIRDLIGSPLAALFGDEPCGQCAAAKAETTKKD